MAASASIPPTPHPSTPRPVDHRRVRVGAHERVGVSLASLLIHEYHARQVFEVDLVNDAGVRGNRTEIAERFLTPLQELVSLLVAVEFEVAIDAQCLG